MSEQDSKQSQYYQEDFLASHSVQPGSDEARRMTVTSGRKCLESFTNCGPLGSLVKMCLDSSIWHSTRCFLTWKRKATKSNVSLFQLAVSMPRTRESDVPLWPTPSTGASLCGGTGNFKTLQRLADAGIITEEERRQLSQGNGGKTNPAFVEWMMGYEQKFTELLPTPRASDYKGAALDRYWTPSSQIIQVERERERKTEAEPVPQPAVRTGRSFSVGQDWQAEPSVGRVAHGVPDRVDRLKCLGNAVVPQQFYPFFRAIAELETR